MDYIFQIILFSDSDSDVPVRSGRGSLLEKINFYFQKTEKSKGERVLIFHDGTFKFTKNTTHHPPLTTTNFLKESRHQKRLRFDM